jgi:hypothetical protein
MRSAATAQLGNLASTLSYRGRMTDKRFASDSSSFGRDGHPPSCYVRLADSHASRLGAARDRDRQRLELIAEHLDRMRNTAISDKGRHPERNDWRTASAC